MHRVRKVHLCHWETGGRESPPTTSSSIILVLLICMIIGPRSQPELVAGKAHCLLVLPSWVRVVCVRLDTLCRPGECGGRGG